MGALPRFSLPPLTLPVLTLLAFTLLCAPLLGGCGSGSGTKAPTEALPGPGPIVDDGDGQDDTLPPPNPTQPPVWNPAAVSYGRTPVFGAFPSDLVRHGDTLFAVDADQIEADGANILAIDVSGTAPVRSATFATTTIHDHDLRDSLGNAGNVNSPVGFGFFLNDMLIVSDTLGFVVVNAGGSDSVPTLSNVVAFNPTTGALRQSFNLATTFLSSALLFDSSGMPLPMSGQFTQSGAEGLAYIPTGTDTGFLYVAMSNLIFGAPSYGAVKNPGTIQFLNVDASQTEPLRAVPEPGQATKTIRTQGYNPIALDTIVVPPPGAGTPTRRLVVTVAGTTGLNSAFQLVPVTPAYVEAYDAITGTVDATFHLGLAGLAGIRPAFGQDAAGHEVGFFPSSVTGEIFLLLLDGLHSANVDFSKLALLRGPNNGIPITAAQAGGPGGNITGIALSPDGRHLAVSGFGDLFAVPQLPGRLFLLSLPDDLVTGGGFTPNFTPGSTQFGAAPGRAVGNVVLTPNSGTRPDVYVNVSGALDVNFFGAGPAGLGSLNTHGLVK